MLWAVNNSVLMPDCPNIDLIQCPIVVEVTALYGLMYKTNNLVEFLKLLVTLT